MGFCFDQQAWATEDPFPMTHPIFWFSFFAAKQAIHWHKTVKRQSLYKFTEDTVYLCTKLSSVFGGLERFPET